MAEMSDDEWRKLQLGFDTHQILDTVGDIDTLRSTLSDDGHQPPELRSQLLKLHGLAMKVINEGSQHHAPELFDLASELGDEASDMLEAMTRIHETLSMLAALRPDSLGGGDNDDSYDA